MSNYRGQANGYSSNADAIKAKLEATKTKYQSMLDGFGVSKVNGKLNYSVAEGDYLTDNVVENLDSSITDIDSIIGEIDGRVSAIRAEADRLDREEELARKKALEEKTDTSESDGDSNV